MEKLLYIMLIWVVSTTSIYSQTVAGKIVDESNQPIEFANIVCLSLPDSTFIYGTISDQDGKFTIPENSSKGILRISSVGYATTYKECKDRNIGTILLHSDTQLLGEVVVKGNLPVTRMKGDALVTSVQNSVLAKAGSANDVLGKVPGILKDKDSFEVFGKGTPLIYINGREVRDKSELEQLSSEDIKHVELITNPGARYDATVNAVVRIQTIRRTGDGFGFNLNSSYYQSENVDLVEQADVNYRHNGLDMFAMFRYDKMEFRERTNVHQTLISKKQLDLENQLKYNDNKQWLRGNIGMNYMFDENNSIGIKYSIQGSPRYDSKLYTTSKVSLDGKVFDRLQNFTSSETDNELNHQLNAYYTGRVGNLEIDFNADYYQSGYLQEDITGEESEEQEDRDVHAASDVANNLAAAKLVLSYPVWKGKFSVGGEWTYTHRKDNYLNVENYVPSSNSKMNEMNITAFAEYSRSISIGDFILGARYEQIKFDYYKDDLHIDDQENLGMYTINYWLKIIGEQGYSGQTTFSNANGLSILSGEEVESYAEKFKKHHVQVTTVVPLNIGSPTIPVEGLANSGVPIMMGTGSFYNQLYPIGSGDILENAKEYCEYNGMITERKLRKSLNYITQGVTALDNEGKQIWPKVGDEASFVLLDAPCSAEAVARATEKVERQLIHKGRMYSE